ncbi:putative tRNA binding domain family protein [Candida albicans]|uniref:Putative tRNA binding domain family protein n=1 Tax=Candida albicans TaxID=5476 RepID=A0A8H6BXH1_CANAX|nr:putative tRNA binding domain family protein [Candida albicans]
MDNIGVGFVFSISLADISKSDSSKFPELSAEQKALASQFETLANRLNEQESLIALNDSLRTKTFIVGNIPSHADLVVLKKWADLVQNTLVNVPEPIKIDYDIDIPREIKEKKKPAKEAEKSATPEPKVKATPDAAQGQRKELTEEEKKAKAAAKEAKKAAKAKANAEKNKQQQAPVATPPNPSMIDFRVGFIEKAEKHPNADSLYMSTIDMGDAEGPRIVCSGLVKYIPIEEMQKRYVVVVANLKPVTMRGVKSCAMVLCASDSEKVEFVNPPAGSKPGDKIFFEGFNGTPEKQLNPKKKVWEAVQPHFSTNENYEVTYTEEGKEPKRLVNEKGELCKNSSIVKADVK